MTIRNCIHTVFLAWLSGSMMPAVALGDPAVRQAEPSASMLAEGGRLYDKWWKEYDLKSPEGTHPSYPSAGRAAGATTWRCKECHGWDYRGRDGAYGAGSHFTGITGITHMAGGDEARVLAVLKDDAHRYDRVMLEPALRLLAQFVAYGQVDMSRYIDAETHAATGEAMRGEGIYEDKCLRCHGEYGNDINFGDSSKPEYLGTVAAKNPWEAVHKIYNGHPGARMTHDLMRSIMMTRGHHMGGRVKLGDRMPYMRGKLSEQEVADLLAYLQSLPADASAP